jgi:hypothetical protein
MVQMIDAQDDVEVEREERRVGEMRLTKSLRTSCSCRVVTAAAFLIVEIEACLLTPISNATALNCPSPGRSNEMQCARFRLRSLMPFANECRQPASGNAGLEVVLIEHVFLSS